jgi:hypothetical protein
VSKYLEKYEYDYFLLLDIKRRANDYLKAVKDNESKGGNAEHIPYKDAKKIVQLNLLGFITDQSQIGTTLHATKEELSEVGRYSFDKKVIKDVLEQRENVAGFLRNEIYEKIKLSPGKKKVNLMKSKKYIGLTKFVVTLEDNSIKEDVVTGIGSITEEELIVIEEMIGLKLNLSEYTYCMFYDSEWGRKGLINEVLQELDSFFDVY